MNKKLDIFFPMLNVEFFSIYTFKKYYKVLLKTGEKATSDDI